MRVRLERTVTDYAQRRRCNVYRREDGKFLVLVTPTNPLNATSKNVHQFIRDTRQEAFELCGGGQP